MGEVLERLSGWEVEDEVEIVGKHDDFAIPL